MREILPTVLQAGLSSNTYFKEIAHHFLRDCGDINAGGVIESAGEFLK